ncbi:MAG: rod shape-determining protein MreC [Bacteroidales bacterium]
MQNLFNFLLKHSSWFLFIFYLIISLSLLFSSNSYQRSVYLNSSNQVVGNLYTLSGEVKSYFDLGSVNKDLSNRNAELEKRVFELQEKLEAINANGVDTTYADSLVRSNYHFIPAKVVNNNVNQLENYITLNRGRLDGVEKDMGVIDHNGIVGIVSSVSDHFCVVISALNTKLRLSAKLKNTDYFGSLVWDGISPENILLEELPRHVVFNAGDTIVTSGYSTVFPEGIMVGTIEESEKQHNDNFFRMKVRLATNFYRLRNVRIIKDKYNAERKALEDKSIAK